MVGTTEGQDVNAHGGRYVLGELLGRGGMAEVFGGHSTGAHGFSKPVAIKRLLPELASDHVFVERLIGEAKLLVGVQHGNIVSVLDLARDGDDVFLVMEYVDGPSVRQLLKACDVRGLPLGVSTYIIQAAAAGLEFAHGRPGGAVIHADVSPSNILLTTAGEVRVADFGIARREGAAAGPIEGKWAYMPPEQARGEPLTPRSDVFALGVVLYEAITGQHPFGFKTVPTQRHGPVVPPSKIKPSIPVGLDQICTRALAADPRDRFPRMQDLIDALVEERYANGWREGASDLRRLIRAHALSNSQSMVDTLVTGRPLTIFTRSLITEPRDSQVAIPQEPIHPSQAAMPYAAPQMMMPAQQAPDLAQLQANAFAQLQRMHALMQPAALRAAAAGGEEVSSTYGSTRASNGSIVADPPPASRWMWVLGPAALVGVIAAVALHGNEDDERQAAEPEPAATAPAPVIAPATPEPPAAASPPAPEPAATAPAPPSAPTVTASQAAPAPVVPPKSAAPVEHQTPGRTVSGHGSQHKRQPGNNAVLRIRTVHNIDAKITIENDETMIHGEVDEGTFTLPPGKYHVVLSNQAQDLWADCGKQSVVAGKLTVLVADMKAKDCWIDN